MQDDPVILALADQVSCYRALAKLTDIQHQCVQNGRSGQLMKVLHSRQRVIDQLAALNPIIRAAKNRWAEFVAGLDADARQRAESMVAETTRLLERITTADRDDVMVLQQQQLNVHRQLQQTTSARQINRNYATAAYGRATPRMDVKL